MAWFSGGSSNTALITNLAKNGLITSERVKNAMLAVCSHLLSLILLFGPTLPLPVFTQSSSLNHPTFRSSLLPTLHDFPPSTITLKVKFQPLTSQQVDRGHFAPREPYQDSPQMIGHSATISAPHMHASAAECLLPYIHPTAQILDIGSGSGYLTTVLAHLVDGDQGGKVVGVEHIPALADLGKRNVGKSSEGRRLLDEGKVGFVVGDGRMGWVDGGDKEERLWDAIHVGAAAKEIHEPLIRQLKAPGRLFIPVEGEGGGQWIWIIDKAVDGSVTRRRDIGVRYVPLGDAPK